MLRLILVPIMLATFLLALMLIINIMKIFANKNFNAYRNEQENINKPRARKGLIDLIKCAVCDVYVPTEDAIVLRGKIFCSEEHAKQGNA